MADILTVLSDEYARTTDRPLSDELKDFITQSQEWLKKHPPVNVVYVDQGFGLRLADGQIVTLHPVNFTAAMQRDSSVAITGSPYDGRIAPSFEQQIIKAY